MLKGDRNNCTRRRGFSSVTGGTKVPLPNCFSYCYWTTVLEPAEGEFSGAELAVAREHFVRMQSLHLKNPYPDVVHQSPDYQWWHSQPALDGGE